MDIFVTQMAIMSIYLTKTIIAVDNSSFEQKVPDPVYIGNDFNFMKLMW